MAPARSPYALRPLGREDGPAVLSLARSLGKWFNAAGLAQMARDLTSHRGYVAVRGDRLLGFATWTRVDEETADLSWMGIAEDAQHQGIGTALLSLLSLDMREYGFRHLTVSTVADSVDYEPYAATRRFYRARGFADYRIDPGYWGEADDRYDRLVLRLDLTSRRTRTNRVPPMSRRSPNGSRGA